MSAIRSDICTSLINSSTWIRCLFCLKQFTPSDKFYIFACNAISCHQCAKKMYSRDDGNRMKCVHCKKVVGCCPIRDEMPPQIRKQFVNPLKLCDEMIAVHSFQQHIQNMTLKRVNAATEQSKQAANEIRFQIQQCTRNTEHVRDSMQPFREQIPKIIPKERLDYLLGQSGLSEEQIDAMTFEELRGLNRQTHRSINRRRSNDFDERSFPSGASNSTIRPHDAFATNRSNSRSRHFPEYANANPRESVNRNSSGQFQPDFGSRPFYLHHNSPQHQNREDAHSRYQLPPRRLSHDGVRFCDVAYRRRSRDH